MKNFRPFSFLPPLSIFVCLFYPTPIFYHHPNIKSSPITLVSEIGGNLFLSKTPSEESGGSPVPPPLIQQDSTKEAPTNMTAG